MIKLAKAISELGTENFTSALKSNIENIDKTLLPLQKGLSLSSYVGSSKIKTIILNIKEHRNEVLVKTGVFYTGIIAGCSCSDDPSPIDEQNEYCELLFNINKNTAETTVKLLNS